MKLFSYDTLVHAIAGASGGVTAITIFYPLDTVRSRLQVEDFREAVSTYAVLKDIIEEEGVVGVYRGLKPVLVSLCASNFVYFYTFHGLRTLFKSQSTGQTALRDLAVAAVAGVVNVFLTTPLWVANSRLKMQGAKLSPEDRKQLKEHPKYQGIADAMYRIASTEGWTTLWNSLVPSLMLVINPAIQFAIYEMLKLEAADWLDQKKLSATTYFLIGAIAKSISTVLTYPLQIVQSKLRYGSDQLKKLNILQIFAHIIRSSGPKGLYKGLEAKLLQTVLTAALMFLCYEKIVAFVFRIMRARKAH